MQLLLVSQKQISPSKTSLALGTLKWLFLGVGALVSLQMLKAGEGTLAGRANVGSWLIGSWRGKVGRCRLGVTSNGRSCC